MSNKLITGSLATMRQTLVDKFTALHADYPQYGLEYLAEYQLVIITRDLKFKGGNIDAGTITLGKKYVPVWGRTSTMSSPQWTLIRFSESLFDCDCYGAEETFPEVADLCRTDDTFYVVEIDCSEVKI